MKQDTAATDKLIISREFWEIKSVSNRVNGDSEGRGCLLLIHKAPAADRCKDPSDAEV